MKSRPIADLPLTATESEIIKRLERNTACGRRQHQVFEDWLEIVEHSLCMIPAHAAAIRDTGKPADDPPHVAHAWKRLREQYPNPSYFTHFSEAYAILMNSTAEPDGSIHWGDAVGNIYMQFGHPNTHAGQYFTPWDLAKMMGMMTCGNLAELVASRVSEALAPVADVFPVSNLEDKPHLLRFVAERFLPSHAERFQPVTVNDPACGSGVMLLAAASSAPHWMSAAGLVQYFGMDLDATCVRMCRINMMLYGLNGFGIKCWAEMPTSKAPPQIAAHVEAVKTEEAKPEPDRAKIAEIALEARALVQPDLFSL